MKKKILIVIGLALMAFTGNLLAEQGGCDCFITATQQVTGEVGTGYWCYSNTGDPCGETIPCKSAPTGSCLAKLCVSPCTTGAANPE